MRPSPLPFIMPCFFEMTDNVEILCECGADVNIQDQAGFTPLHAAVISGNHETLDILVFANREQRFGGMDANIQDDEGNTALHYACWKGNRKILKTLLSTGACYTNIRNKAGKVPSEMVASSSVSERGKIMLLLEKYANEATESVLQEVEAANRKRRDQAKQSERESQKKGGVGVRGGRTHDGAAKEQQEDDDDEDDDFYQSGRRSRKSNSSWKVSAPTDFQEFVAMHKAFSLEGLQPDQLSTLQQMFESSLQHIGELLKKKKGSC